MTQNHNRPPQQLKNNNNHGRQFRRPSHNQNGNKSALRSVVGVTGLKHIGGRINEEYRKALMLWSSECKLYLEMKDDPIISAQLDAIKLPLQAASFDVEPAKGGSSDDEAAAEWLYNCMNSMEGQTWNSHVEDALECLDFGFSIGEIVLDKRADGRLWLRNIEPRGQETLYRWLYEDAENKDRLTGFEQADPNSSQVYNIPIEKCTHFMFRGRKGNPQGKSLLSALYRPYKFARNLEDLEGIGVERDVGGMPIAKLGEGDYTSDDIENIKAALKGMRKDEESYLIEPNGIDIRAYGGGNKLYDTNIIIDRWHKILLMRFFSQFLILGMSNVGTQSLVKGSQDFFSLALEAVQRYLLETWNLQLVPYLFRFNQWQGLSGYPKIVWEKPGKVDLTALVNALNAASGAKLFTPTDIDEDHLRAIADLPELPDEERGAPRSVEQPPIAGLFDLPNKIDQLEKKINRGDK